VARLDNVALLAALRDLSSELERKARERTQDLADRNLSLTREVSERRHVEEALRESEEKFRIAFMTSPDSAKRSSWSRTTSSCDGSRAERWKVARNGSEALTLAGQEPASIRLVVTDVVLMELGGSVVGERPRELHQEIRVLFVSGYPQDSTAPDGLSSKA
jgi:CheY-like chemotaxis protein